MMMNNCVQKICNKKFHYIEPHYIPRVKLESKQHRKKERKICPHDFFMNRYLVNFLWQP